MRQVAGKNKRGMIINKDRRFRQVKWSGSIPSKTGISSLRNKVASG